MFLCMIDIDLTGLNILDRNNERKKQDEHPVFDVMTTLIPVFLRHV